MPLKTLAKIQGLANGGGKALVNGLFPNEFEYYAVTLELVDSEDRTVDFFTFPVNPNSMTYNYMSAANIKKTMGGVIVYDTESYIPQKYTMSGTFGRSLKVLLGRDITHPDSTQQGSWTKVSSAFSIGTSLLNAAVKTGYGATKLLEAIVDKSSGLDEFNRPHRLYLYNPALGHSFLVKVNSFVPRQSFPDSNMLWQYELTMTTISPLDRILLDEDKRSGSLNNITAMPVLQRTATQLLNQISSII